MEKRVRDVIGGALRPNDPRRFLVEAMIGAMHADGSVDAREQGILERHVASHPLFGGVNPGAAKTLVELATDAVRFAGSAAARVPVIARGLPSRIHRITGYAMACEIAAADAEISHEEMTFLETLRLQLRIATHEAQDIFHALHAGTLAAHLEDRLLRVRTLVPFAVELFTLRAHALGRAVDDHRFALRDFFVALPDMALPQDEIEGAFYHAFRRPRSGDVYTELCALAQHLLDPVDRWWMVVYAIAAEAPGTVSSWRVIPFIAMMQHAFGLTDADMDLAASDAQIFPANVPRPV
jgi:uncharacterized tellurite resistance protein B-like protein